MSSNLRNVIERILGNARACPHVANNVHVHRQLIGELRMALEVQDETSTEPDHTLVLRICTAYEQGFGQSGRALENPYTAGTRESEAWNTGWQVAKQRTLDAVKSLAADLAPTPPKTGCSESSGKIPKEPQ